MAGELIAPQYVTGPQGVSAVTLTPITAIASDGTPTYGSDQSVLSYWESVDFTPRTTNVNLAPSSVIGANNQPTLDDWTLTLRGYVMDQTGIAQPSTNLNVSDVLMNLMLQFRRFKIIVDKGGVRMIYWGTLQDGGDTLNRQQNMQSLTFARLGLANQGNPQRASIV